MDEILLEVGVEDIPVDESATIENNFIDLFTTLCKKHFIEVNSADLYLTPRRIIFTSKISSYTNPPPKTLSINFETHREIEAFAGKFNVDIKDVKINGTTATINIHAQKEKSKKYVPLIIKETLKSIPFHKKMRWGNEGVFIRPVRWILFLYNTKAYKMKLFDIYSNSYTYTQKKKKSVKSFKELNLFLKKNGVIVDKSLRIARIKEGIYSYIKGGFQVDVDDEIIERVASKTEFPSPFLCRIDERYIRMGDAICSRVIKNENFLPVLKDGKLYGFIAFRDGSTKTPYIIKCFERVINSRLEDVLFYYEIDLAKKPSEVYEKLNGVLYMGKLNLFQKKERVKRHMLYLANKLNLLENSAIEISDYYLIDLVLQTVREYPQLERIFAGIYLQHHGFDISICNAIIESIKPLPNSMEIPQTLQGKILSLSHRMDDIVLNFDQIDKVSIEDPFGVRRNSNAIIKILKGLDIDFGEYLKFISEEFGVDFGRLKEFFIKRIKAFFEASGFKSNHINVFESEVLNVGVLYRKLNALNGVDGEVLERLVVCYKRVKNILKKLGRYNIVDEGRFVYEDEKLLFKMINELEEVDIGSIVKFYEPLDRFFKNVLVDDPVPENKQNRLALLSLIEKKFDSFGDLTRL